MSLLSELSRGTGTLDGAVVGEGFETLSTYSLLKASERKKLYHDKIPSTYLTRRGNLILYTRADQPPKWESQVLDHYKNIGSLVSQVEEVALNKHQIKKEMDQRCTPGRPLNPYLGLLKNSLLCSNTVKAISDVMEVEMSASGQSFPKKGLSPGLEMLPRQLEEMGVNIAEFLQGKGSLSHLVPPEQISDILREMEARERTMDTLSANEPCDGIRPDSTMPTPAPPQSPLPEETSIQRNVSRSASARLRHSSSRRGGSAKSAAQGSEADSAYGTKSADMSTIMSELNLTDTPSPRPGSGIAVKAASPPPLINNSGDYSGQDRPIYWLPEVSETTYSFSVDDTEDLHSEEQEGTSQLQPQSETVKQNNTEIRPSQIRTAEWIKQSSASRIVTPHTPLINRDEAEAISRPSTQTISNRVSTTDPTADETFSELERLKPQHMDDSTSREIPEISVEGLKSVSGSGFSSSQKNQTIPSTEQPTEETLTSSIDASSDPTYTNSRFEKYQEESRDLVMIQSYRANKKVKQTDSQNELSQPSSAASSVSLSEEVVVGFPDRNASNVYGVPRSQSPGELMGKESGFSGDSAFTEETSKQPQSQRYEDLRQTVKQASDVTSHSTRPASNTSNTPSGIEAKPATAMTSQIDQQSLTLDIGGRLDASPLLKVSSPVGDRIGTPSMDVPVPTTKLQLPDHVSSTESLSPRPPSVPKAGQSAVTSPRRKVQSKPSKTPRRGKTPTTSKPKRSVKTAPGSGRSQQPPSVVQKEIGEEERAQIEADRLAIEAAAAAEKQRRLAQAAALQNKIKDAAELRKEAEREAERKKQEMEAELKALAAEEDAMKMMEEETRQQMMTARKDAREARERRRREDLEKKKEEIRRRKEDDIRRQELAGIREREMLQRLGDPNLRQRMAADDAARKALQERELEERLAEEEREAAERAALEERRMEEFERLAEEEAISRLREDMCDVEERRRELEYQSKVLEEEKEARRLLTSRCNLSIGCSCGREENRGREKDPGRDKPTKTGRRGASENKTCSGGGKSASEIRKGI